MNKALSYVIIGALSTSAVILYVQNKQEIMHKMHKIQEDGMRQFNKVKARFE